METPRHPSNPATPQLRFARHPSHNEKLGLHGVSPHREKRESANPIMRNCGVWACPHSEDAPAGIGRQKKMLEIPSRAAILCPNDTLPL